MVNTSTLLRSSADLACRHQRLKRQCENLDLPIIAPPPVAASSFPMAPDAQENAFRRALAQADVVLDCVFGVSLSDPVQRIELTIV